MGDYFCGWYFKCQSAQQTLALIPAEHRHRGQRSYSLQLIAPSGSWNVPLDCEQAEVRRDRPCAVLGESVFSPQGVRLAVRTPQLQAEGTLRFGELSAIRYDIMGPFRYVPFLECRHSVVSMRHRVTGALTVNGKDYRFENASGYLEGDRGRSFPRHYAWTQCCAPGGSLMLSVAEIPLGPVRFTGVIAVVQLEGKEYRLATYTGAKAVRIRAGEIVVRQGRLQLTAQLLEQAGCPLRAPQGGQMTRTIREHVACRARYQLKQDSRVLWAFESDSASFEYEYPE